VSADSSTDGGDASTPDADVLAKTRISSDLEDSVLSRFREAGADSSGWIPCAGCIVDGKYRIDGTLGRGGAGIVFSAHHLESDRPVAIKWMLPRENQLRLRRRFVQEARAAGRIRHPNVIDVHDVVSSDSGTYLVMEWLEGESLRTRLKRGPLPVEEAVEVCVAILRGLVEAHRLGVIHRDLKPENVFLCAPPRAGVKVLDFGICAIDEHLPALRSALTQTGEFVGTPVYTALERLRERHPFDHRVDVYSVGVILYEAITGKLPYVASSLSELTYQLTTASPRPPSELRSIDAHLEQVVLRALSRDPQDRFPDATAFIAALEAPSQATVAPRTYRRVTRFVSSALGVVLLVAGAIALAAARGVPALRAHAGAGAPPGGGDTQAAIAPAKTAVSVPATVGERTARRESPSRGADSDELGNQGAVPRARATDTNTLPASINRHPVHPRPALPTVPNGKSEAPTGAAASEVVPAHLNIVVVPYGDVWVDGIPVGPSPRHIAVTAGRHTIAGGRTNPEYETSVLVSSGESRKVVFGEPRAEEQTAPER
jgi:hypothetical protein